MLASLQSLVCLLVSNKSKYACGTPAQRRVALGPHGAGWSHTLRQDLDNLANDRESAPRRMHAIVSPHNNNIINHTHHTGTTTLYLQIVLGCSRE